MLTRVDLPLKPESMSHFHYTQLSIAGSQLCANFIYKCIEHFKHYSWETVVFKMLSVLPLYQEWGVSIHAEFDTFCKHLRLLKK